MDLVVNHEGAKIGFYVRKSGRLKVGKILVPKEYNGKTIPSKPDGDFKLYFYI